MSKHEEFPELTPEARAACDAACIAWQVGKFNAYPADRRAFAAFLREAIKQARRRRSLFSELEEIADSLHSPPPPTLAQARAADLNTPEGRDAVRAFLATLGEGQP